MLSFYPRQQHWDGAVVNVIPGVDLHAVHHAVGAAIEDDAPDVGEGLQLFQGDVVGVDFAVYPQGPDFPGQAGIFLAAKVEDEYHILFHCGCRLLQKICFYFTISAGQVQRAEGKIKARIHRQAVLQRAFGPKGMVAEISIRAIPVLLIPGRFGSGR